MGESPFTRFDASLLGFLAELRDHNQRDWFKANRSRYDDEVVRPVMNFIEAMEPRLASISPHFLAIPARVGGSMMRIYRDIRFSTNKSPYKTNVGIQFRHEVGKDVHAPGYYVHIEPDSLFLGVGIWHPGSPALTMIRRHIDQHPGEWQRARDDPGFGKLFELVGDSLKTAPRDYPKDHPLIEDLRRKDFLAGRTLSERQVLGPRFIDLVTESFGAATPLMRFLCSALDVPF